jgi:hypothetical protein
MDTVKGGLLIAVGLFVLWLAVTDVDVNGVKVPRLSLLGQAFGFLRGVIPANANASGAINDSGGIYTV